MGPPLANQHAACFHALSTMCAGAQVGCADILGRIVEDLKDESEPYRRMVMETIDKVVSDLGTADVDARLEELLIDGILYAFQEQVWGSVQKGHVVDVGSQGLVSSMWMRSSGSTD